MSTAESKQPQSITKAEFKDIVASMLNTLDGDIKKIDEVFVSEIKSIYADIGEMRQDLSSLRPHETKEKDIAKATDELDAVVKETEKATGTILGAAETIESLFPLFDEKMQQTLSEQTTSIFQACTFQDITGQRVNKVVQTLKKVEKRMDHLIENYGFILQEAKLPEENTFLEGPQHEGKGTSQDDIDAMFN